MHSISNILIANRGEIARRIIRTAKKMGISTFAIYTDDEKQALHAIEADHSCSIGKGSFHETYLNIPLIIDIARKYNCDAIHPGYGFLSENAAFARACQSAGIIFIGPQPEVIGLMGNKAEARRFVGELGIPLPKSIRGNHLEEVLKQVADLNFPMIIKAAAGGGGKGMKIVHSLDELPEAWVTASREALAYFGDAEVYVEQYIEEARHIEVQILGDNFGNIVHLYDRECSIQRRHQKIIEEAPSPTLPDNVRQSLLDTAVNIARSLNYTSAGTLEFLVDKHLNFYFLEMNTRIQVEHPVTEAITGIDIVKEQICIAEGKLLFTQDKVKRQGHAIECRLYAEDPFSEFLPSSGYLNHIYLPEENGIRIESSFNTSGIVSSSFDPLLAKVTSFAPSREECIYQLHSYFRKAAIHGVKTNLEYLTGILEESEFMHNIISTHYCGAKADMLQQGNVNKRKEIDPAWIIASALAYYFSSLRTSAEASVWQSLGPWRSIPFMEFHMQGNKAEVWFNVVSKSRIKFSLGEKEHLISGIENQQSLIVFHLDGLKTTALVSESEDILYVTLWGIGFELTRSDLPHISMLNKKTLNEEPMNGKHILSPLNGKIIRLNVKKGDKVKKGDTLLIIESMKMENKIIAPVEAEVSEVNVAGGDHVSGNELLIKLTSLN